ncbi:MAG: glycosyltransferase [Rudaea sp.]
MRIVDASKTKTVADDAVVNDPSIPLVSILIRSMDRPSLQRAMQSAARQTWRNVEIVVVAACGPKHRDLVKTFLGRPVRLIRHDRPLSRPDAANVALESAHGEWLNFLDDDDELLSAHVAKLLDAPRTRNERVVFSATRALDKNGQTLGQISHDGNHVQLFFHSRSMLGATLIHRSLVDEGARFDPDFPVHEDHDFQIDCATRTEFLFVKQATCIWNAQVGDSGCGIGLNDDRAQRREAVSRIRTKWAAVFERWLLDFDAVLFTGQHYLKGGDIPVALECLERALALRPTDVNALNLCGMANLHAKRLDRAEALVTAAAARAPNNRLLQENLALIRAKRAKAS